MELESEPSEGLFPDHYIHVYSWVVHCSLVAVTGCTSKYFVGCDVKYTTCCQPCSPLAARRGWLATKLLQFLSEIITA
jgi:hypothetical protein